MYRRTCILISNRHVRGPFERRTIYNGHDSNEGLRWLLKDSHCLVVFKSAPSDRHKSRSSPQCDCASRLQCPVVLECSSADQYLRGNFPVDIDLVRHATKQAKQDFSTMFSLVHVVRLSKTSEARRAFQVKKASPVTSSKGGKSVDMFSPCYRIAEEVLCR